MMTYDFMYDNTHGLACPYTPVCSRPSGLNPTYKFTYTADNSGSGLYPEDEAPTDGLTIINSVDSTC